MIVNFKKRLGDFILDVNLTLVVNGITVLFGRSGSGKTTLINMMAGLLIPDEGIFKIGNRTLYHSADRVNIKPERRRIGYVFQEDRLFPHLTVKANLFFGRRFAPKTNRYVDPSQVIELLGLTNFLKRGPMTLSGGERQRVAIGRALLSEPRLLLMDEPLAALDSERKSEIMAYIERLRDELSVPIVYVSHSLEEVGRLADNTVLLSNGTVVAMGPTVDIMGRPDLRPHTGRHEAGAIINTRVKYHDKVGLTTLNFTGGNLQVAKLDLALGTSVRVRIRARDVVIATVVPESISILNIFKGKVLEIIEGNEGDIDLRLDIGVNLWARITRRSSNELKLTPGCQVYALIKSVAIDRHSLGLIVPPRRKK